MWSGEEDQAFGGCSARWSQERRQGWAGVSLHKGRFTRTRGSQSVGPVGTPVAEGLLGEAGGRGGASWAAQARVGTAATRG